MDSKGAVEAALFSASEPLTAKQISENMGIPVEDVLPSVKKLMAEYDKRKSAMKVIKIGNSYRMLLRDEYTERTAGVMKLEMSKPLMKTMWAIAYHQPLRQSELSRTLGPRVYEDIPKLIEMGLVDAKEEGQTRILSTTKLFSERFADGTKPADMKRWIDEKQSQRTLKTE